MRIIEESSALVQFTMLNSGDVFSYEDELYIKIMIGQGENLLFNAVELETGMLEYIAPYSDVIYQDVELRVRDF